MRLAIRILCVAVVALWLLNLRWDFGIALSRFAGVDCWRGYLNVGYPVGLAEFSDNTYSRRAAVWYQDGGLSLPIIPKLDIPRNAAGLLPLEYWFLRVPLWPFALLSGWYLLRATLAAPLQPGCCRVCRYDLRGLPATSVCPECGTPPRAPFDAASASQRQL